MDDPTVVDTDRCQVRYVHEQEVAAARAVLRDDTTYAALAALFGALADPTRAKIVHLLMDREWCTCDIAAVIGMSDSSVSQHLRVLRSLRLVRSRRTGKFVYYRLDDAHVTLMVQVGLTHQGHGSTTTALEAAQPAPKGATC